MIIQRTSNDLHEAIIHTIPGASLDTLYQSRKVAQKRAARPATHRWVCEACGMPHTGSLPTECESCGRADAFAPEQHPRTEIFSRW